VELHDETLMLIGRRDISLPTDDPVALDRVVRRFARNWTLEARDLLDSSRGLATRISRVPSRGWFRSAVPDELDQQLILDVLYFVRSADSAPEGDLPIGRIADRYGLDHAECFARIEAAADALRHSRPAWIEQNLDVPLGNRTTAS
jgi:hypothetical protein